MIYTNLKRNIIELIIFVTVAATSIKMDEWPVTLGVSDFAMLSDTTASPSL